MKKYFILAITAATLSVYSCKKNEEKDSKAKTEKTDNEKEDSNTEKVDLNTETAASNKTVEETFYEFMAEQEKYDKAGEIDKAFEVNNNLSKWFDTLSMKEKGEYAAAQDKYDWEKGHERMQEMDVVERAKFYQEQIKHYKYSEENLKKWMNDAEEWESSLTDDERAQIASSLESESDETEELEF